MANQFHISIRQSLQTHPLRWTRNSVLLLVFAGIGLAMILAAVQVSLRYDANDAERWWSYYFLNQMSGWGQWLWWGPLFIHFITKMILKFRNAFYAIVSIVITVLVLALLAATVEGLVWHTLYNTSSEWPWARVWKASLSNQTGFHFLIAGTLLLLLMARQLFHITKEARDNTPLVRNGHGDVEGSLIVKHKGQTEFIPLSHISHLEASGSYVEIYADQGKTVVTGSLKQFGAQLPEPHFIRIHRSYIVRVDHVLKLTPLTNEDYKIVTSLGHELRVSRSYKKVLPILKGSNGAINLQTN